MKSTRIVALLYVLGVMPHSCCNAAVEEHDELLDIDEVGRHDGINKASSAAVISSAAEVRRFEFNICYTYRIPLLLLLLLLLIDVEVEHAMISRFSRFLFWFQMNSSVIAFLFVCLNE